MVMAKATEGDKGNSKSQSEAQEYPPSWVDRFSDWVDGLPGPSWLYYLALGLVLLVVQTAVLWIEGVYPIGTFLPIHLVGAGGVSYLLALLPWLDNTAAVALSALRPALRASEEEYSQLRYQLTTLRARPTLVASLVAVAFVILADQLGVTLSSFEAVAGYPVSAGLMYFIYLIGWWIAGAFIYHTIHQLRLINRIHTKHTRVDLFRMRPLYAFSRLTALTAASLTLTLYADIAVQPGVLEDPRVIAIASIIVVLAVATFAWPLLGIHRLLVEEKGRLLDENSLLLEAKLVELHQGLNRGELDGMENLNMAIASLEIEQNVLNRIPTWPWQPETVRLLVTALLLPLGLWIVQIVLQVIMGP
jgi:hypothetical protein